jgi:hypothetical protein
MFLKIQESIGILILKVGTHFGMCGFILSHSLTFSKVWNVIPGLPSRLAPLQALALVTSPKLGSRRIAYDNIYVNNIYGMNLYFIHLYYFTKVVHGDTLHLNLISIFIIINKLIIYQPSNKMQIRVWHMFICES